MRVFHQNESCLLALSLLHNSREDGGKQGSFHIDEKLSFWSDTTEHFCPQKALRFYICCGLFLALWDFLLLMFGNVLLSQMLMYVGPPIEGIHTARCECGGITGIPGADIGGRDWGGKQWKAHQSSRVHQEWVEKNTGKWIRWRAEK